MFERLEDRRLLTTAGLSSSGLLSIVGTTQADHISVTLTSSGRVAVSGVASTFRASSVKTISILGKQGNDIISISSKVSYKSSTIDGGAGADTVTGGSSSDTLIFGDGDVLDGAGGKDNVEVDGKDSTSDVDDMLVEGNVSKNELVVDNTHKSDERAVVTNVETLRIFLNAGNDRLTIHASAHNIAAAVEAHGGTGNDDFETLNGKRDSLFGDSGKDTANYDGDPNDTGSHVKDLFTQ